MNYCVATVVDQKQIRKYVIVLFGAQGRNDNGFMYLKYRE